METIQATQNLFLSKSVIRKTKGEDSQMKRFNRYTKQMHCVGLIGIWSQTEWGNKKALC